MRILLGEQIYVNLLPCESGNFALKVTDNFLESQNKFDCKKRDHLKFMNNVCVKLSSFTALIPVHPDFIYNRFIDNQGNIDTYCFLLCKYVFYIVVINFVSNRLEHFSWVMKSF